MSNPVQEFDDTKFVGLAQPKMLNNYDLDHIIENLIVDERKRLNAILLDAQSHWHQHMNGIYPFEVLPVITTVGYTLDNIQIQLVGAKVRWHLLKELAGIYNGVYFNPIHGSHGGVRRMLPDAEFKMENMPTGIAHINWNDKPIEDKM